MATLLIILAAAVAFASAAVLDGMVLLGVATLGAVSVVLGGALRYRSRHGGRTSRA